MGAEKAAAGSFEIATERDGDTYVVRLLGELDLSGCDRLEGELARAEETDASTILLDIDSLTFIDSHGLRTVLKAAKQSEQGTNRLRVTRGAGHVADLLRLTALDQTLPFD
jgi:anti-sigma B factor antagonist